MVTVKLTVSCAKISAEGGLVSLVEHIGIAHMVFFVVNGADLL